MQFSRILVGLLYDLVRKQSLRARNCKGLTGLAGKTNLAAIPFFGAEP